MTTKTFQYIAFWDRNAWVAGTTCCDLVCQGATIEQAVQRLSHSCYAEAVYALQEGKRPFEGSRALPKFSNLEGTFPTPPPTEQFNKSARYTGSFEVTWKGPAEQRATP